MSNPWMMVMAVLACMAAGAPAMADEAGQAPPGWRVKQTIPALILESADQHTLTVQVGEPASAGSSLQRWMKRLEGRSLGPLGSFSDCRFTGKHEPVPMGALACHRRASAEAPVGLILGVQRVDGQYQYLATGATPETIEAALQRMTALLVQAAMGELDDLHQTVTVAPTPPADPLRAEDIEGVFLVQIYGLNGFSFTPYLLLKNGEVLRRLVTPPTMLARDEAARERPEDWGRWTVSGGHYTFTWPDGEAESWIEGSQIYRMRPAGDGERIDGTFQSIASSGNTGLGGDFLAGSWSSLRLDAQGRFALDAGSGGGGYGSSVLHQQATRHGRYTLDGFGAELVFADGTIERLAFYLFEPRKDPPTFGLGNRVFSPRD